MILFEEERGDLGDRGKLRDQGEMERGLTTLWFDKINIEPHSSTMDDLVGSYISLFSWPPLEVPTFFLGTLSRC